MLIVDSHEVDATLRDAADAIKLLEYPNPASPDHPYSYDLELHTAGGLILRGERKRGDDAVDSFLEGKLDRQCSAVDFLVVEFNDMAIEMGAPTSDAERRAYFAKVEATKKHLARLALCMPVIQTGSVGETVSILRYLIKQEDLRVFANSIKVDGASLRERLVRSQSGTITSSKFKDIWPKVDRTMLLQALQVDSWPISPSVRRRIMADLGSA